MEEILDKMNYDLVMSLTVEAPVSNQTTVTTACTVVTCTLSVEMWLASGQLLNK